MAQALTSTFSNKMCHEFCLPFLPHLNLMFFPADSHWEVRKGFLQGLLDMGGLGLGVPRAAELLQFWLAALRCLLLCSPAGTEV